MTASYYYPKAAATLRVVFEDFRQGSDARLAKTYEIQCTPRRVNVNINDYTQADTFSCELDYKDFPFDPRAIRALGVTIHMEDVHGDIMPKSENTIFQGFADEDSIELDESSRTVKFEGRDFTALLIDAPYPKDSTIPLSTPLEVLLRQIVVQLPSTFELRVENRSGDTLPTLAQFAPDFNGLSGEKNVKRDETYWDVIQDLVGRAGLIAYIELDTLVITKPRVLYKKDQAIQFVYGKNLKKLEFKRKLGRQKNFNIRVLSLDLEGKEVIEAKIPEEATEEWSQSIGIPRNRIQIPKNEVRSFGHQAIQKGVTNKYGSASPKATELEDAPFLTFRLPDIRNKDRLVKVGESIFEAVGRQQIEGTFSTREMKMSQDIKNNERKTFDLLRMRNGTPVAIEIDQIDMEKIRRISTEAARAQYLLDAGYPTNVASAIASAYGKVPMVFYTKAVEFSLDDQGFDLRVDFVNFIDLDNRSLR